MSIEIDVATDPVWNSAMTMALRHDSDLQSVVASGRLNATGVNHVVSAATILKGFDRLRRRIAMRIAGEEGAFAGYERIELFFENDVSSDGLCLVGWVLPSLSLSHHRVCYSAYILLPDECAGVGDLDLLVAHAVGTTVLPTRTAAFADDGVSS